jgi:hypothetical protein
LAEDFVAGDIVFVGWRVVYAEILGLEVVLEGSTFKADMKEKSYEFNDT